MTFCFVDIIPNNRKVVLTFFLHSSELQNSTKLLKPLAEVTVNWLATCVLCLLFFPTKHHENHKRLMNRSALKSFGEWCFQKPPSFDGTFIHKNLQLLCLHVSICSISSKSLSKLHKGPAQGEAGRRELGEHWVPFTTKNARKTSLITWYSLRAGRLNCFLQIVTGNPWIRNPVFFRAKGSCWKKWLQGFLTWSPKYTQ